MPIEFRPATRIAANRYTVEVCFDSFRAANTFFNQFGALLGERKHLRIVPVDRHCAKCDALTLVMNQLQLPTGDTKPVCAICGTPYDATR